MPPKTRQKSVKSDEKVDDIYNDGDNSPSDVSPKRDMSEIKQLESDQLHLGLPDEGEDHSTRQMPKLETPTEVGDLKLGAKIPHSGDAHVQGQPFVMKDKKDPLSSLDESEWDIDSWRLPLRYREYENKEMCRYMSQYAKWATKQSNDGLDGLNNSTMESYIEKFVKQRKIILSNLSVNSMDSSLTNLAGKTKHEMIEEIKKISFFEKIPVFKGKSTASSNGEQWAEIVSRKLGVLRDRTRATDSAILEALFEKISRSVFDIVERDMQEASARGASYTLTDFLQHIRTTYKCPTYEYMAWSKFMHLPATMRKDMHDDVGIIKTINNFDTTLAVLSHKWNTVIQEEVVKNMFLYCGTESFIKYLTTQRLDPSQLTMSQLKEAARGCNNFAKGKYVGNDEWLVDYSPKHNSNKPSNKNDNKKNNSSSKNQESSSNKRQDTTAKGSNNTVTTDSKQQQSNGMCFHCGNDAHRTNQCTLPVEKQQCKLAPEWYLTKFKKKVQWYRDRAAEHLNNVVSQSETDGKHLTPIAENKTSSNVFSTNDDIDEWQIDTIRSVWPQIRETSLNIYDVSVRESSRDDLTNCDSSRSSSSHTHPLSFVRHSSSPHTRARGSNETIVHNDDFCVMVNLVRCRDMASNFNYLVTLRRLSRCRRWTTWLLLSLKITRSHSLMNSGHSLLNSGQ
jgi:hypothetical protein